MKFFEYDGQRVFLGRLDRGDDVLLELTEFCVRHGVEVGSVAAVGAVERGRIGYYDHQAREYRENQFDEGMEIAVLTGNVSRKDGQTFLHCHVVLADGDGRSFGGHLNEGNVAFACEFSVTALDGPVPERTHDETTGLALW
jgi:predicted DNA-binding protein with PD1-like motif